MTGKVEELSNGVVVYQATDEEAPKSNIYCEFPWCSPDSRRFVYTRRRPELAPNTWEFVECEFGTWAKRVLGSGAGPCTMAGDWFCYRRQTAREGGRELVQINLSTGEDEVRDIPEGVRGGGVHLSPDRRYLAYSYAVSFRPQLFAVELADLDTGECRVLHQDPYICNTHLQFERGKGRQLLVQHNRGCVFSAEGKCEILCGKEGCTLFLLDVPSGTVTHLDIGPPYTASCSGHETWLGDSGKILLTLNIAEDYDHGKGPIVTVAPGQPHRQVCPPWEMNHIGVPPNGRVFAADTFSPDAVLIGSPFTDRAVVVCPARTSYRRGTPDSHPHAYISPDLKWVVFNSDRTGINQVYAAAIPEAMIAEIESAPPSS